MSLTILIYTLKIIIFIIIINVWVFRKNKPTPYRGGNAKTLKEEFAVYKLPKKSFYMIGTVKIICSTMILISICIKELEMISILTLSLIMCGSLLMHAKIKDPFKKSYPALIILIMLFSIMNLV